MGEVLSQREAGYVRWLNLPAQAAQRERNVALAQVVDGAVDGALPSLRRLAGRSRADWRDKHNLAAALLSVGDSESALKWLRRARTDGASGDKVAYVTALAYLVLGDEEAARDSLAQQLQVPAGRRVALLQAALDSGALAGGDAPAGRSPEAFLDQLTKFAQSQQFRLRIAYLAVHTGITGGARILFEQANGLTSRGHQVTVLSHGPQPQWLPLTADFRQVPPYELLSDETQDVDVVLGSFWTQFHDLARAESPTAIFFAQGDQFVWEPESLDPAMRRLVEASHRLAPAPLLTVSEAMAEQLAKVYGRRAQVVPNGIDPTLFRPRPELRGSVLRLLTMGRDSLAFKGVQDVFAAAQQLRARGLNFELTWITPEEPEETPPVGCKVVVAPSQQQLAELYAGADIFVSGSRYESFSLPPLEALASGTAVVAVDNAGLRTYAKHGVNCLLTAAGDVDALADAVVALATDGVRREQLVAGGLQTAAQFGWPSVIPLLEQKLLHFWLGDTLIAGEPRRPEPERISLCMIARDEETTIGRCLESAKDKVDEIIVIDTGSQDRTQEIARSFGAKVYDSPWKNDFSEARNQGLERATGDWILVLDADEQVAPDDPDVFRKLLRAHLGADGLTLPISNLVDESDPMSRVVQENLRLFRNRPQHRFEQPVHEQVSDTIQRAGGVVQRTPVALVHYGYLPSVRRAKNKSERNTTLLRQEVEQNPEDSVAHFNLANEYLAVADYLAAKEEFLTARRLASPAQRPLTYYSRLMYNLIKVYMVLGQVPEALALVDEAAALYPDYTDLWFLKGQILAKTGPPEQSLAAFDHCLTLGDAPAKYFSVEGTGLWLPWYQKGQVYKEQGRLKEAMSACAKAVALQPAYREAAAYLAYLGANLVLSEAELAEFDALMQPSLYADELLSQAHYKAHRFARAGRFADRVKPTGPIVLARSAARLVDGDFEAARAALAGLEVAPGDRSELLRLQTVINWADGRMQVALETCQGLQELDEEAGRAFLAVHATLAGSAPQGAAPRLDKAGMPQVLAVLGLLIDLGRYELFERALALFQASPQEDWKVPVGKMLHQRGFTDLAFEFLVTVGNLDLLDEDTLRMLGDGALERGFAAEAASFFRRAASLSTRPALYSPRIAHALLKGGKIEEAAGILGPLPTSMAMEPKQRG